VTAAEAAIVAATDIVKAYGNVVALAGVTIIVHPGQLLALTGPSGSGKTTLLNIIAGWERADAGRVRWETPPSGWTDLAVVPQQPGLLEELSALENVTLPVRLGGTPTTDPVDLLNELEIGHLADRLPHELSHGEQQRVSIARALLTSPRLLVADEPTAHLDAAATEVVLDVLYAATYTGTACLIASHDARVVEEAHRVVALHDGRLAD
jgi:putative ABC transport system ATP-binding protein